MTNRQKIKDAGLDFFLKNCKRRLNWNDSDELVDINTCVGFVYESIENMSLAYVYTVHKRYTSKSFLSEFTKSIIEAYLSLCEVQSIDYENRQLYLRALCINDSHCMSVANILWVQGIDNAEKLKMVNQMDVVKLGIHKGSWNRFLDLVQTYVHDYSFEDRKF